MSIDYTLKLYIDWSNNGDFDGTEEDVSANVQTLASKRGRSSVQDVVAPGEMNFTLLNLSGTYSPYNAASSIYGKMFPGRRVKCEVVTAGGTYPVFFGDLGDFGQQGTVGENNTVEGQAFDAMERFSRGRLKLYALKDVQAHEIIWETLESVGFQELMDLDTASNFLLASWAWNLNPREILERAAREDLGATIYIGNDGRFAFRNKTWRAEKTSRLTITQPKTAGVGLRRSDFLNEVVLLRSGLVEDLDETVVFQLSPVGRLMRPGYTDPANLLVGEYSGAAFDLVTPVATTDWTFNTLADGSGVDKTAQVVVYSFTNYGGGFEIVFQNNDASDVYLTKLEVRGTSIYQSNDDREITSDVVSPVVVEQTFQEEYENNDDSTAIQAYANFIAGVSNVLQPRPIIEITPKTTAALEDLLELEFGDRITLDIDDAVNGLYINDDFHVETIEWDFAIGDLPRVRLSLFHRDFVRGSLFRISSSSDVSKQYSTIRAAGATTGDRIAW
jgi:hypothetical protein